MSGFGPGADWLRNIESNGQLEVSIGRSTFPATYRLLEVEESVRVFAEYERRNIVVRPVIRAVLGRLVGWRFDGSDAARHKLADQLPIVAFRPLTRSYDRAGDTTPTTAYRSTFGGLWARRRWA